MGAPRPMSEFDGFKDSYRVEVERSIGFIGQDLDYFTAAKARAIVDLARRTIGDPSGLSVLDLGCGTGQTDRFLAGRFGRLYGVDPSDGSLDRARTANPDVEYLAGDGTEIPLPDGSVDLIFAICVLHHIPSADWPAVATEMTRVLRPGGVLAIFEHNPYNPLTRRAVSGCVFDDGVELLSRRRTTRVLDQAGLARVEARYILFLPFGGERLAGFERRLGAVPLGAQYYVAGRRP